MSDSITAYYDRQRDKQDRYVQSVKEKFEQRSQIGIKKYNTTLEREDLDFMAWINHAQEEAMDFILYLEKLKDFAQKTT
jgi:succinate dehydrogenase flavin-adding protein (antitoxin of CptAB toxin-antitoxin module)